MVSGCGLIKVAQDRDQWRACEYGNEAAVSIRSKEFADYLSDCWLPRKDSVPWNYHAHLPMFFRLKWCTFMYRLLQPIHIHYKMERNISSAPYPREYLSKLIVSILKDFSYL
jgi:hypothetical protein